MNFYGIKRGSSTPHVLRNHRQEELMRVSSLFSGIGGLDYGLHLAGHEVIFQAEIDPNARQVRGYNAEEFIVNPKLDQS